MSMIQRRSERSLWMFVVIVLCAQIYVTHCRIQKLTWENDLFKKMIENAEIAIPPED